MFCCVVETRGFTGPLFMGVLVYLTRTFVAHPFFMAVLNIAIVAIALTLRLPSASDPKTVS